jgi:hypothetical protein
MNIKAAAAENPDPLKPAINDPKVVVQPITVAAAAAACLIFSIEFDPPILFATGCIHFGRRERERPRRSSTSEP